MYVHTCLHAYMPTCIHQHITGLTYIHAYMPTCIHPCVRTLHAYIAHILVYCQAWKWAKSSLRRLILGLFGPRPGSEPKVASEGSFWIFLGPGLEMNQKQPQKAHFEPFWAHAWTWAKSSLRRLILSLFGSRLGNEPKVASEGTFWYFLDPCLQMSQK